MERVEPERTCWLMLPYQHKDSTPWRNQGPHMAAPHQPYSGDMTTLIMALTLVTTLLVNPTHALHLLPLKAYDTPGHSLALKHSSLSSPDTSLSWIHFSLWSQGPDSCEVSLPLLGL